MPDLNELLKWSIANSTNPEAAQEAASEQAEQLQLRFNPVSTHSGTSALHPNDRAPAPVPDLSPASTPGPGTPKDGEPLPLPSGAKREDLTTEMLDLIMGKSDSITMKEKIAYASNEENPVEERVEALDDFEMLIELIDNANNMPILKLWQPLLALLASPHPEIVAHTCWIIGTAVQNNLKAQAALYIFDALPQILNTLYPSTAPQTSAVRAKATYALSSALKHWPLASPALAASQGYTVLKKGVQDEEVVVRRKMAFLIGTLVMQSGEKYEGEIPGEVVNLLEANMKETEKNGPNETLLQGLKREGVLSALLEGLKSSTEDVEYEENAVRALVRAAEKDGLTAEEKAALQSIWVGWGAKGQEERGLDGQDGQEISAVLSA
ncbi:hypothetical protein L202_02053 [Cryptococcus amylolentus CBS 6039]|uniref:Nucleotide exchange factor Fes1 domain-containing protein n=2 Tax=Cryptococcus amylolentus TaxID=104669 RepID=A0A1E3HZ82_9TREE|nr:hypothetical protein L202_02053 [Cryptococcus amylolentus CBS 6039]ODN81654.1 hypothetical protein L202_02053 [Cryptococcus amylolentus CBS 6039]ODO10138.1 hypothetical protein I350_02366 [Cryptococcus amylolentus CBS 6273]